MSTKIVLLVEDNPHDELLTTRALVKARSDIQIHIARDGEEASDFLLWEGEFVGKERIVPDLILMDLKLPKVDGLELIRITRRNEHTRYVPVIVLTSSTEQQDIIDSQSVGANSYVRKLVSFPEFIEVVKKLADYWLFINEIPAVTTASVAKRIVTETTPRPSV